MKKGHKMPESGRLKLIQVKQDRIARTRISAEIAQLVVEGKLRKATVLAKEHGHLFFKAQ